MYPDLGNGRIINRDSTLRSTSVLTVNDLTSPLCESCFGGQIRYIITLHVQAVILFMRSADFRTDYSQIQDLNKMRDIKACYLYIRLVLTPGFRLAFKTLGIIRLGSLKFHQEISGIRKSF